MNRRSYLIKILFAGLACLLVSPVRADSEDNAGLFPSGVRRVVFLGDSITYAGQYVADIAACQQARYPGRPVEIIDVGLPSETVSGLSEPGHAGGKFPRPDLHERLARVLAKTKPDLVFACYGMNDGIYMPFDESRFKAFRDGIEWLHAEVTRTGARLIHVTPPVFDEVKGGHPGYGDVLDRYSAWLVTRRTNGWVVVDVHTPMKQYLAARRLVDPTFAFSRDGIHPDDLGHWVMARQILAYLGVSRALDAKTARDLLAEFPDGEAILMREQKELSVWKDAWLTAIGHKRPGMKHGLPMVIDPNTGGARLATNSISPAAATP